MGIQYDVMISELYEAAMFSVPSGTLSFVNPYPEFCNIGSGGQENALFFYHPDHLGSTGMVTDANANATQGFLYAPFGEIITEYNSAWQANRIPKYSFNAKELDEENGMYYYSARYYAPPTFISRDLMMDAKPWLSPYHYCSNSPVKYIDPDGRDWYESVELNSNGERSTFWREGNAETATVNGEKYRNIGETYSRTVGNATYNYNQKTLETIDYTTGATFQAQTTGTGCKIAADNMTRSSGANPSPGRTGEILMANHDANGVVTTPTANAAAGVNRMETAIENGYAITIGVDYKSQQQHNFAPNGDGMTDHFMSVVGMTVNVQTGNTTYQFYDPGSSANGNSPANTMSLQGGFLQGNLSFGKQSAFKVTTVRKNR